MKLNSKLLWQQLTVALVLLVSAVAADSVCQDHCGDVEVPYPFGIGNDPKCYLDSRFKLNCDIINSKLYRGNIPILHIDIPKGEVEVWFNIAKFCSNDTRRPHIDLKYWFSISSKANKFVTIGCDSYGILKSIDKNDSYSTGCLTICDSLKSNIDDGTCSGRGCCQVDIPPLMNEIRLQASSFDHDDIPCSYSFVVKAESHFRFNPTYLHNFTFKTSRMVLDWNIGTDDSCKGACTEHSDCLYDTDSAGYRCNCSSGYEGNPYIRDGCKDIDECMISNPCKSGNKCENTPGSYTCSCPKWQYKTKEGECQEILLYVLGAGAAIIFLFAGTFSYLTYQKKKLIKLKDEFYRENGGPELQKKLRQINIKTFTEEQLKKATKNYDESLILGRGGFGTVYKGTLEDNTTVAIKKPKKVDAGQKEEFFNEMFVLSQVNQRNLVKLLGCCLETQLLLVYEFVSNGTLSDFIKKSKGNTSNKTWETRLKIATEVAGALSYLHKDVPNPIIHRDIKSANILMDDNDTPKIADFGSSMLVPHDQNEVSAMVQGTFGYLDPEYLQTNKLTDKSDVYSFGVVLAELITGQKALSRDRTEENLAQHFLTCIRNDSIVRIFQDGIRNDENEQEIKEVAIIASKCLRLKGAKRPSMKEVARELEGLLLKKEKHTCINADLIYLEETQYLLGEASSRTYESGDSYKSHRDGATNWA